MIARALIHTVNPKLFRQHIICNNLHLNGIVSKFTTVSSPEPIADANDALKSTTVPTNKPRLHEDFRRTFCTPELEQILEGFPPKLRNRKHNFPETLYVAHPKAVNIIAEHLLKDHRRDKTLVEINPGLGLLTQKLIESNVEDIRLFEGTREFLPALQVMFLFLNYQ